jgi:hypothetical protein
MKIQTTALALFTSLCLGLTAVPVSAHGSEEHNVPKSAGPNGGRILKGTDPRAEFFVTSDRKVQITFLNHHGEPVAPADQTVIVTAGDRSAPTRLTFSSAGQVLLSDGTLPAGNRVPTVVQITPANAKQVTAKFNINLAICPGCQLPEYACICEGH